MAKVKSWIRMSSPSDSVCVSERLRELNSVWATDKEHQRHNLRIRPDMLSAVGRLHWLANIFGTRLDDIYMTLAHIPSHTW